MSIAEIQNSLKNPEHTQKSVKFLKFFYEIGTPRTLKVMITAKNHVNEWIPSIFPVTVTLKCLVILVS